MDLWEKWMVLREQMIGTSGFSELDWIWSEGWFFTDFHLITFIKVLKGHGLGGIFSHKGDKSRARQVFYLCKFSFKSLLKGPKISQWQWALAHGWWWWWVGPISTRIVWPTPQERKEKGNRDKKPKESINRDTNREKKTEHLNFWQRQRQRSLEMRERLVWKPRRDKVEKIKRS